MAEERARRWDRAVVVGVVVAMLVLLGACGDDDTSSGDTTSGDTSSGDTASGDTASGDPDPTTGDGADTGDTDGDTTDAADDFPIPRPDGLVLDVLADSGIEAPGQRQLYYEGGDFDRVVAFYDDWTSGESGWMRNESDGVVVFSAADTDGVRTITVTPDFDPGAQADGPVTYVLLVSTA